MRNLIHLSMNPTSDLPACPVAHPIHPGITLRRLAIIRHSHSVSASIAPASDTGELGRCPFFNTATFGHFRLRAYSDQHSLFACTNMILCSPLTEHEATRNMYGGNKVTNGNPVEGQEDHERPDLNLLTKREREVLSLLPDGKADRLLARHLGISERTLRAHITSIKRKLGYRSRIEVTIAADRHQRGSSHPA
ncbi:LuxR C-terminal-related transcriptional regulator [Streptomyces sp. SID8364]|uniref:response regulator transcription factor n=2 Tax=Streptomyces TaxID=1883 RepID=UPI0031B9E052